MFVKRIATALFAVLSLASLGAPPALAGHVNASCSLLNKGLLKSTFGLSHVATSRGPSDDQDGGYSDECDAAVASFAVTGPIPRAKRAADAKAGKLVLVTLTTYESDGGSDPLFDPNKVLTDFEVGAHALFITSWHGKAFSVPNDGADVGLGFEGPHAGLREADAMWRTGDGRLIELAIVEKPSLSIEPRLKKIAANAVAAFTS